MQQDSLPILAKIMTNMLGINNIILVDSDGLIGLSNKTDPNHEKCLDISKYLLKNSFVTVTPYPIVLEAATALSRDSKINRPDLANKILENYIQYGEKAEIDEDVAAQVRDTFSKNTSRKNTPFDHYLCALAKKNNIKYVFSFDAFYKKQGLTLAEELLK